MPPVPKKSKWLQQVEDDAIRITEKRFSDHFAEAEYQRSKREEEMQPKQPTAAVEVSDAPEDKKGK